MKGNKCMHAQLYLAHTWGHLHHHWIRPRSVALCYHLMLLLREAFSTFAWSLLHLDACKTRHTMQMSNLHLWECAYIYTSSLACTHVCIHTHLPELCVTAATDVSDSMVDFSWANVLAIIFSRLMVPIDWAQHKDAGVCVLCHHTHMNIGSSVIPLVDSMHRRAIHWQKPFPLLHIQDTITIPIKHILSQNVQVLYNQCVIFWGWWSWIVQRILPCKRSIWPSVWWLSSRVYISISKHLQEGNTSNRNHLREHVSLYQ